MYTIEFVCSDGQLVVIHRVNEIEVGSSYDSLEKVPTEDIMNYVFPVHGIYRLTGITVNATYFADDSVICVTVKKG